MMKPILHLLALACTSTISMLQAADSAQPNIIFLLSDDQHWNETSVQMHPEFKTSKSSIYLTPHLEEMASKGMRFSAAYAPAPVCSPTRASIMTGMSPAALKWGRAGSSIHHPSLKLLTPSTRKSLADEPVFPQFLKKVGYTCAHFGKWHLGVDPAQKGFDVSDGNIGNEASAKYSDPDNPVDIFGMTERATAFMKKAKSEGLSLIHI